MTQEEFEEAVKKQEELMNKAREDSINSGWKKAFAIDEAVKKAALYDELMKAQPERDEWTKGYMQGVKDATNKPKDQEIEKLKNEVLELFIENQKLKGWER